MTDTSKLEISQRYLGLVDYDEGLVAQQRVLEELAMGQADAVLLGLEHQPVITLGVRGRVIDDIRMSGENLRLKGFQVRHSGRGGQATLHSPGQLVIYPCVNLRAFGLGARRFVDLVQSVTADWFASLGVSVTASSNEPGLFHDGAKIAAFGFKIERGLTSHGLAINVANDLEHFEMIRMCGVSAQRVARLQDLGVSLDPRELFPSWALLFKANLERQRSLYSPKLDDGRELPLV